MLSPRLAVQLRTRGFDALAVLEDPELVGLPDGQLLLAATERNRCLVTLNTADFVVLDQLWRKEGREHSGIVCIPSSSFPRNQGFLGRVLAALDALFERGQVPGPGELTLLAARP